MSQYSKDKIAKEYLKGKSQRYSETSNPEIHDFIEKNITLDLSHKEKVYCFLNDIVPKCKICGSLTTFNDFKQGFKETCSNSCSVKLNKKKQEETRIKNANDRTVGMTPKDLVHALVTKKIKIQKWRDLDILKEYTEFKSLHQVYDYLIKGEEQRCKYCDEIFLIDPKTKEHRKCTCRTKNEKHVIDIKDKAPAEFLDIFIKNTLYYPKSKNNIIDGIYFSKFAKRSDNFMEQLYLDCKDHGIKFYGFYSNTSKKEHEIADFIRSVYSGEIILGDRKVLSGKELDIYLPEKKIAIEFDGLYWHSSRFKPSRYHLEKTEACEKVGIHLIHIFENEWIHKQEIVKSIIKSKLGIQERRIYARKCSILDLSFNEAREFFNHNHIQGSTVSSIQVGLVLENEILCAISLARSHRSKDRYLEIKRFCSVLNTNVIGGFSKLLKYVKNKILNEDLVTFADRRYSSSNNVYSKNGKLIGCTSPNYFYIFENELKSREQFMKHKLSSILENFDKDLSEKENMRNHEFWEIHDCGNYKYIL